jgi:hypothetical protein
MLDECEVDIVVVVLLGNEMTTVGYARMNVIGSRTSSVIASVHCSTHLNICS